MKRVFLLFVLLLAGVAGFCQSEAIDNRLYSTYSEETLSNLQANFPEEIVFLNWKLDNSYEIKYSSEADFPKLRYLDKETKLSAGYVETFDDENINIMEYFIEWDYAKSVAYRIGDTDAVIIFYSGKDLTEAFNNYMGYEDEK